MRVIGFAASLLLVASAGVAACGSSDKHSLARDLGGAGGEGGSGQPRDGGSSNSSQAGDHSGAGHGAGAGASSAGSGGEGMACEETASCGQACCAEDEACFAAVRCLPEQAPCGDNDDCSHDSFCQAGACVPYGLPDGVDRDVDCQIDVASGELDPVVQCRWLDPPAGDAHPTFNQVMATPMVVDFDTDDDPLTLDPSIVFASYAPLAYVQAGVLRVIRGRDCAQQWSLDAPEDAVSAAAPVALGDIDDDGRPEIIAAAHGGGLVAFGYDAANDRFQRLWRSGSCANDVRTPDVTGGTNQWSGPSIADLDDDGVPELLYGATVYGADGCIISSALGYPFYSQGVVPVVADIDGDGRVELIQGNALHEWDTATAQWLSEPFFVGSGLTLGQVAVAELGSNPIAQLGGKDFPEIAVVSAGLVRVQTLTGAVVFGPVPIPGGGGGPPTIADFDGDGRAEIGVAGGAAYAIYDLDCVSGGDPQGCGGEARTNGILWSQPAQDFTSSVTGSSLFDFDADGRAEVAYADECFFRLYDGASGSIRASIANSSATTYENPVIADVDGDFRSEIVVIANDDYFGSLNCPLADPLHPATASASARGVAVLRDSADGWAASRPIWNQHAYSVTNVTDSGTIPASSDVVANWSDPALNNFRQNAQGELEALGVSDLTVSDAGSECDGDAVVLRANVCNRGTLPASPPLEVAFSREAQSLCQGTTEHALAPGSCVIVECRPTLGKESILVDLSADPSEVLRECYEANNQGRALVRGCR